jgi:hypothetical protein
VFTSPHVIIGYIVILFSLIQPIIGIEFTTYTTHRLLLHQRYCCESIVCAWSRRSSDLARSNPLVDRPHSHISRYSKCSIIVIVVDVVCKIVGFLNCLFGLALYFNPNEVAFPGSLVPFIIWALVKKNTIHRFCCNFISHVDQNRLCLVTRLLVNLLLVLDMAMVATNVRFFIILATNYFDKITFLL